MTFYDVHGGLTIISHNCAQHFDMICVFSTQAAAIRDIHQLKVDIRHRTLHQLQVVIQVLPVAIQVDTLLLVPEDTQVPSSQVATSLLHMMT